MDPESLHFSGPEGPPGGQEESGGGRFPVPPPFPLPISPRRFLIRRIRQVRGRVRQRVGQHALQDSPRQGPSASCQGAQGHVQALGRGNEHEAGVPGPRQEERIFRPVACRRARRILCPVFHRVRQGGIVQGTERGSHVTQRRHPLHLESGVVRSPVLPPKHPGRERSGQASEGVARDIVGSQQMGRENGAMGGGRSDLRGIPHVVTSTSTAWSEPLHHQDRKWLKDGASLLASPMQRAAPAARTEKGCRFRARGGLLQGAALREGGGVRERDGLRLRERDALREGQRLGSPDHLADAGDRRDAHGKPATRGRAGSPPGPTDDLGRKGEGRSALDGDEVEGGEGHG